MYNDLAPIKVPYIAGWSNLVARRAHNPKVVGSNPAPATKKTLHTLWCTEFFLVFGSGFVLIFPSGYEPDGRAWHSHRNNYVLAPISMSPNFLRLLTKYVYMLYNKISVLKL